MKSGGLEESDETLFLVKQKVSYLLTKKSTSMEECINIMSALSPF